jgi:AcrR family transcriptional regulator
MSHREKLLTAARKCLEAKGYARTTARDLVNASGTNLGSISYHFGTKEALLNEAIGAAFVSWTQEVMSVVRRTPADDPLERMLAGWRAMLDRTEANRALITANMEAMAQVARSEDLRERMAAAYDICRTTIAEAVLESVPPGAEQHAPVIASFIMSVVDGITLQWMTDPEHAPSGEQLEQSLRLMFAALASGSPAAARPEPDSAR